MSNDNPDWAHCFGDADRSKSNDIHSIPCDTSTSWSSSATMWTPYLPSNPGSRDLNNGIQYQFAADTSVCLDCGNDWCDLWTCNVKTDKQFLRFEDTYKIVVRVNNKVLDDYGAGSKQVKLNSYYSTSANQKYTMACRPGQTPIYGYSDQAIGCVLCAAGK